MRLSVNGVRPSSRPLPRSFRTLKPSSGATCSACQTLPPCQLRRPTSGCPQPIPGSCSLSPACDWKTADARVLHRVIQVNGAGRRIRRTTLATRYAFGLVTNDGQDPVVAWSCRNCREHSVEGHCDNGCCRPSTNAPRRRFVDEIGCSYLSDVGLATDSLA